MCADCASECGVLNTSVLVKPRNGQSAFVHLATTAILPGSGIPGRMTGGTEDSEVGVGSSTAGGGNVDIKTKKDNISKKTPKVRLVDSVTKVRRRLSFFRSTDHKRSRARFPGPRPAVDNSEGVGCETKHSGMRGRLSMTNPIRRESRSIRPANRIRKWRRRVMSRAWYEWRAGTKKE